MVRHRHKYFVMARDREIRWQHLRVQLRSPHSNSRTDAHSLEYAWSDAHPYEDWFWILYKLPSDVFHRCSISRLSIAILSFRVEGSKNPSIIRSFPCSYSIWWVSCLTSTDRGGGESLCSKLTPCLFPLIDRRCSAHCCSVQVYSTISTLHAVTTSLLAPTTIRHLVYCHTFRPFFNL